MRRIIEDTEFVARLNWFAFRKTNNDFYLCVMDALRGVA